MAEIDRPEIISVATNDKGGCIIVTNTNQAFSVEAGAIREDQAYLVHQTAEGLQLDTATVKSGVIKSLLEDWFNAVSRSALERTYPKMDITSTPKESKH